MPLTRYGVASVGGGFDEVVAVAFGSLEVKLLSFPKQPKVGEWLDLRAEVGARFASARLSITVPGGDVRQWTFDTREAQSPMQFPRAGVYRLLCPRDCFGSSTRWSQILGRSSPPTVTSDFSPLGTTG
jgi:hypothetical protein